MQSTTTKVRRQQKPLAPATGAVKVLRAVGEVNDRVGEIRIGADANTKDYYVAVFPGGYRLHGWDGRKGEPTVYDLPADLSSCDCPDHTYRGERPGGCRHMRALAALKAAGRLPEPPAADAPAHDYKPGHSSGIAF